MLPRLAEIQSYLSEIPDGEKSRRIDLKISDVLADWVSVGADIVPADFPPVQDISIYVPKSEQYPQVAILPFRITQQFVSKPYNERLTWEVNLQIVNSNIDAKVCEFQLMVIAEAITRLFGLDETLGLRVDGAYISDVSFTEAVAMQKSNQILQGAMLTAVIKSRLQFQDEKTISYQ